MPTRDDLLVTLLEPHVQDGRLPNSGVACMDLFRLLLTFTVIAFVTAIIGMLLGTFETTLGAIAVFGPISVAVATT